MCNRYRLAAKLLLSLAIVPFTSCVAAGEQDTESLTTTKGNLPKRECWLTVAKAGEENAIQGGRTALPIQCQYEEATGWYVSYAPEGINPVSSICDPNFYNITFDEARTLAGYRWPQDPDYTDQDYGGWNYFGPVTPNTATRDVSRVGTMSIGPQTPGQIHGFYKTTNLMSAHFWYHCGHQHHVPDQFQ